MTKSEGSDDSFGDIWDSDSFREFLEDQRNMEHRLREYIKNMIESLKREQLQGKSEIIPIDKPGVTGFIFRGVFGTPEALEGEGKLPELGGRKTKSKEGFAIPEAGKEELREPVIEEFESGTEFVMVVELPGAEEQDISLETGDNWIKIGAINFKTTQIRVPSNADTSKTTKTYRNGVLEIRVPLTAEVKSDENVKFGMA